MLAWRGAAIVGLVVALAACVAAESAFPAHRMIRYESEGSLLGSTVAGLSRPIADWRNNASLAGSVAILTVDVATPQVLASVTRAQQAAGLLIVIPRKPSVEQQKSWAATERFLIATRLDLPVLIAFDDEATELMTMVANSAGVDTITVTTSGPEPVKVTTMDSVSLHGLLAGSGGLTASGAVQPTVVITAYYDALAVAPTLATGTDSNGSGATALLSLARLFSAAYASPRTQAKVNLMFVLTGAGKLNHIGTREWIEAYAYRTKNIEFVLSLDGLESGASELFLHQVTAPKPGSGAAAFVAALTAAGAGAGVKITPLVGPATSADGEDSTTFGWEHQRFARANHAAGTLSARQRTELAMASADTYDSARGSLANLERVIVVLARALASHVYALPDGADAVIALERDIDREHIAAWRALFASTPRFAPLLSGSPLVAALAKDLESSLGEIVQSKVSLASQLVAYTAVPVTITAARTKPVYFELVLVFAAALVLLALKVALSGPRAVIASAATLFARGGSKAKRT